MATKASLLQPSIFPLERKKKSKLVNVSFPFNSTFEYHLEYHHHQPPIFFSNALLFLLSLSLTSSSQTLTLTLTLTMPSVAIKLYSVFFKLLLKHRLQSLNPTADEFGITSRPEESISPSNPSFSGDGVATKDIHIDLLTSLSLRIFLPDLFTISSNSSRNGSIAAYRGYLPSPATRHRALSRRIPIILQFHGGGFVSGSNTSTANDLFCRRIVKLLDVIVIAVGYRLAPESRYPAAFDDGINVLHWLAKQANLAECGRSIGSQRGGDGRRMDKQRHVVDAFGAATVEPWLAAHADFSRYDFGDCL